MVSKLTEIYFKKIYISTSWRVIGNFRGVEGFKPNFSVGGRSMDIFGNNAVSV